MNDLIKVFHTHSNNRTRYFRSHRHAAIEFSFIVRGDGIYRIDDRIHPIHTGDVFVYYINESHYMTDITSENGMEIINVQIEPRYFWESSERAPLLLGIKKRCGRKENRMPGNDPFTESMSELIRKASDETDDPDSFSDLMVSEYINLLLILVNRKENLSEDKSVIVNSSKLNSLNVSMEYIGNHYLESLKLEELSKIAGFSPNYYCSLFKEYNGITVCEYIILKRLDHAMKLLRESDENILSIALLSGFNNGTNFNKQFKKFTGLTPHQYRSNHI